MSSLSEKSFLVEQYNLNCIQFLLRTLPLNLQSKECARARCQGIASRRRKLVRIPPVSSSAPTSVPPAPPAIHPAALRARAITSDMHFHPVLSLLSDVPWPLLSRAYALKRAASTPSQSPAQGMPGSSATIGGMGSARSRTRSDSSPAARALGRSGSPSPVANSGGSAVTTHGVRRGSASQSPTPLSSDPSLQANRPTSRRPIVHKRSLSFPQGRIMIAFPVRTSWKVDVCFPSYI